MRDNPFPIRVSIFLNPPKPVCCQLSSIPLKVGQSETLNELILLSFLCLQLFNYKIMFRWCLVMNTLCARSISISKCPNSNLAIILFLNNNINFKIKCLKKWRGNALNWIRPDRIQMDRKLKWVMSIGSSCIRQLSL